MKLQLNKKTGFRVNKQPVIINDFRGIEFYNTSILKKPVKKFNLPPGKYEVINGSISELHFPVNYKLKKLPPKQRNLTSAKLRIKFGNNPNKASILHKPNKRVMLIDNSFKKQPLYIIWFIYYHEIGHKYYDNKHEKGADSFARNIMLKKGYNPSQIGLAILFSLSHRQFERKKHIINTAQ